jgi:DNA-binding transcriptional MocR family regulator
MTDDDGTIPASLREACLGGVRAFYSMPTIHNPLGGVMPLGRRNEIVAIAREHDLLLLEDDAYGFLAPAAPPHFALLAPERAFYVYSLSKPFAPAVKVSFLIAPERFQSTLTNTIRITSSGVAPLLAAAMCQAIENGTLNTLILAKRQDAIRRQEIARDVFRHVPFAAHPSSYHLWLTVPMSREAQQIHASLRLEGVDITPAGAFEVSPTERIRGLRVALGSECDLERLREGLLLVERHVS